MAATEPVPRDINSSHLNIKANEEQQLTGQEWPGLPACFVIFEDTLSLSAGLRVQRLDYVNRTRALVERLGLPSRARSKFLPGSR